MVFMEKFDSKPKWSKHCDISLEQIVAMVKKHGKDFDRIAVALGGQKSRKQVMTRISYAKMQMRRWPELEDLEFLKLTTVGGERDRMKDEYKKSLNAQAKQTISELLHEMTGEVKRDSNLSNDRIIDSDEERLQLHLDKMSEITQRLPALNPALMKDAAAAAVPDFLQVKMEEPDDENDRGH